MSKNKIFQALAKNYNQKRALDKTSFQQTIGELAKQLEHAKTVLDLGCGAGRILIPLAHLFPKTEFFAFDISGEMLEGLKKSSLKDNLKNITLIEGDFNQEDWLDRLPKRGFGGIIVLQVIHFFKDQKMAAVNLEKIVLPGGKLIIASTTHEQFKRLPYCLAFPEIMQVELNRTPDINQLLKLYKNLGFQFKGSAHIKAKRDFQNKKEIKRWLMARPFSALSLISDRLFLEGVRHFLAKYSGEVVVDEFTIFTLVKSDHK